MQGRLLPDDINNLQHYPEKEWKDEFYIAESIGFDFVELLYDINQSNQNPLVKINGHNVLQNELKKTRLIHYSICADYFTKNPLLDQGNSSSLNKLIRLIEISAAINNSLIVIPLLNDNDCSNYNDFVRFLKIIKPIVDKTRDTGLKISLEVSLDAETVVKTLNSNQINVSICYDFGNATAFGHNISKEIKCLKKYLSHVHIKDRKKNYGSNVLLGDGDVDFISGFKALRDINYTGNFTLETAMGSKPIVSAKNHYLFAKKLISTLP